MSRSKVPQHLIAKPIPQEQRDYYKKRQRPKGEGYLVIGILAFIMAPFLRLWHKFTGK